MEDSTNTQDTERLISENGEDAEVTGCFSYFCHPRKKGHKFIALIFMCFLEFGLYFCYDNPAALQNYIRQDLNITVYQYTMLYSVYSWPNIILCFINGFLIDGVFGVRFGTNLFMSITFIGQVIFASGAYCNQFWLMLCGRFIFGIGGGTLAVGQYNYALRWFDVNELSVLFGLQLSLARLGSTVNFMSMDSIYKWVNEAFTGPHGLGIVLFIATSTCVISLICALILSCLDKRAERLLRRHDEVREDVVRLLDIKDFEVTFWFVTIICVTYYVAIFLFIVLAKDFFADKFKIQSLEANILNSIIYLISGIISPFFGIVIDRTGKNILWIIFAISITIGAHSLLAFTEVSPYVAMVMMGVAFSTLTCSISPLVSLIIPEHQLITAYGVRQAIQNLGLAVISILVGFIEHIWKYTALEIFFIGCLSVALLSALLLWTVDGYRTGLLNMTPTERLGHQQSVFAAERQNALSETSSVSTTDLIHSMEL